MARDPLDVIAEICHDQPPDALEKIAQALGFTETRDRAIRDEGFNMGTIAALAVLTVHGDGTQWGDVVLAAGTQSVLRHALTHEGDWKWGGFHLHAVPELGRPEVAKARRHVVNAARRRNAGVPVLHVQTFSHATPTSGKESA